MAHLRPVGDDERAPEPDTTRPDVGGRYWLTRRGVTVEIMAHTDTGFWARVVSHTNTEYRVGSDLHIYDGGYRLTIEES